MTKHRPIRFRAWADDKMRAVRAVSFTEKGELFRILDAEGVERWPTALMQYTGFKDRKRREVYDGDIVAVNGLARTVVEWKEYRWHPQIPKKTVYEVIGNVWESPELLKASNKKI